MSPWLAYFLGLITGPVLYAVADKVGRVARPRHWWIYDHETTSVYAGGVRKVSHQHEYAAARWTFRHLAWWHFRLWARPRCESTRRDRAAQVTAGPHEHVWIEQVEDDRRHPGPPERWTECYRCAVEKGEGDQ